jgi:high-affinity iron transporter
VNASPNAAPLVGAALGLGTAVLFGWLIYRGALLTFGPSGLSFEAQEAIGGTLSIIAVGLVTWMIFWMARTARHMKSDLHHKLDDALGAGKKAVVVVAMLAVGREGLETALFLWASAQATSGTAVNASPNAAPLVGAALGLGTAVLFGWLIYRGALRLNMRLFFAWTGLFLVVIAAGVLAYGVHALQEAGILPGLNNLAFDVSATIPPSSWYGTVLKGVFNFSPATTWLELAAWLAYVLPTAGLFFLRRPRAPRPATSPAAPAAAR